MEDTVLRRTWAEIDLDALAHNYHQARLRIGPGVKYLGVVKADAYGHGAVQVARKLEQLGAEALSHRQRDLCRVESLVQVLYGLCHQPEDHLLSAEGPERFPLPAGVCRHSGQRLPRLGAADGQSGPGWVHP